MQKFIEETDSSPLCPNSESTLSWMRLDHMRKSVCVCVWASLILFHNSKCLQSVKQAWMHSKQNKETRGTCTIYFENEMADYGIWCAGKRRGREGRSKSKNSKPGKQRQTVSQQLCLLAVVVSRVHGYTFFCHNILIGYLAKDVCLTK